MPDSQTRRILTKREGVIEPLVPNPPLLTSGGAWRGIVLEKHLANVDYVRTNFENHSDLIHCFTGRPVQQEW